MSHSFSATGFVLKRSDVGEADRVVTIFTREFGKLTAIAKGCRKLSSSRAAALEPGSLSKIYLVRTHSLPILTQAQLIDEFPGNKKDLSHLRKAFEVLEMLDSLLIEEDIQEAVFMRTHAIFNHLSSDAVKSTVIREHLSSIIEDLGFGEKQEMDFSKPIRDFVEEITSRKLKAYAFLTTS